MIEKRRRFPIVPSRPRASHLDGEIAATIIGLGAENDAPVGSRLFRAVAGAARGVQEAVGSTTGGAIAANDPRRQLPFQISNFCSPHRPILVSRLIEKPSRVGIGNARLLGAGKGTADGRIIALGESFDGAVR
jgi:hypothetical protein